MRSYFRAEVDAARAPPHGNEVLRARTRHAARRRGHSRCLDYAQVTPADQISTRPEKPEPCDTT